MFKKTYKTINMFLATVLMLSTLPFTSLAMFYASAEGGTTEDGATDVVGEEVLVETSDQEYELYPIPRKIDYLEDSFDLEGEVNLVVEDAIDHFTEERLEETLGLKDIEFNYSDEIIDGKINILVGVNDSDGYVDTYVKENFDIVTEDLFNKIDSHYLRIEDSVITILGKETDAAFYGITTLYHVLKQMDTLTIKNLVIEDYADVISRGFIEGYYGEPWSTEDRIELMKFGGYYKLNSYFYAPKDDPKHNAKWRELYDEEEIADMARLAEAGNKSKNRFVYAIHPFMNNPIRFNENYDNDYKVLTDKLEQMLDAGVRQISILGDDAGVPGDNPNNYVRLLTDLTDWIHEKQKDYPGLKDVIPFVPNDYMGWGDSGQIQTLKKLPKNIQIVMTGGKVWGEVSQNFTSTFTKNAGRGPYMWINWPVTDNSKQHLIMGGGHEFLQPNVDPGDIEGIVLNPMQQSEPSKLAIFYGAAYSWNIWDSEEEALEAWENAFSYVDHNSAIETESSLALKELSKHMINQDMDSRVVELQESIELAPKLDELKAKLASGDVNLEDVDKLVHEFLILKDAAETYRENPGNPRTRDQMIPWLNSWDDTLAAVLAYLDAIKAYINEDDSTLVAKYLQGQKAFADSKTHGFSYIDHIEYAEVGVQHIVPFIKTLESDLGEKVNKALGLDKDDETTFDYKVIKSDTWRIYQGAESNLYDGDDNTFVWYNPKDTAPNKDTARIGDYLGYDFGRVEELGSAHIVVGAGDADKLKTYSIETSVDNETWTPVEGYENYKGKESGKDVLDIDLGGIKARYIRIVNKEMRNKWVKFSEFTVEEYADRSSEYVYTNVEDHSFEPMVTTDRAVLSEGVLDLHPEEYIGLDLKLMKDISSIDVDFNGEGIVLEASENAYEWFAGDSISELDARYIRLINKSDQKVTTTINQFNVEINSIQQADFMSTTIPRSPRWSENDVRLIKNGKNAFDNDLSTAMSVAGYPQKGDHIIFDLGQMRDVHSMRYYIDENNQNYIRNAVFEMTDDLENGEWTELFTVGDGSEDNQWNNSVAKDANYLTHDSQNPGYMYSGNDDLNVSGQYIRVRFTTTYDHRFVNFNELMINDGEYVPQEIYREITSDSVEKPYRIASNMFDQDIGTYYEPADESGSFTYHVSDALNVQSLKFVQTGKISNALVTAELYSAFGSMETETVELGTLDQIINEFIIPVGKIVKNVTVSWEENPPAISEIITSAIEREEPTELEIATAAVEKAEETKSAEDIAAAQGLVSALEDSVEKTDLQDRLDAIEVEAPEETEEEAKRAAVLVDRMIYRLPNVRVLAVDDTELVESVRTAYDKLSDQAKTHVKYLSNLELREDRLEILNSEEEVADEFAVRELQRRIYRLPSARVLTLEDASQVEAIREDYNALNDASKDIFSPQYLKNLELREIKLDELRSNE